MLLRELYEAPKKVAVAAFGRMNPPTIGHEKLVEKLKSFNGDHYIFLSQTQKPKDNPLPFDVKLNFAKKFFPGVNVGHPTVRTPIQMLQMLEKLGYTDIIYVAGSDRVASFDKLFNDYNGKEYNFNSITVENAGERDPDADGAEGMSASKMRQAAVDNDLESFKQGVPQPQLADEMFAAVRQGMGIKDEATAEGWFGFGKGDPLEAPKWLNDENKALWQKTEPTTKDKRLVKQLKKLQRFIKAGLTDQANQVVAKELSMMQREGIEESKKRKKRLDPKCWKGYRKDGTKMKGGTRVNNCVKVSEDEYTWEGDLHMLYDEDDLMEADYQGRNVKLGKPMQGDVKKFKVYVKNPKGNVVKVNFGHGGSSAKGKTMSIKKNNPGARKSFRARHNCDSPGPRHKARYWSCRKW